MDVTLFWSRFPGRFVNKKTGGEITLPGYKFEGSPREWYETLVETIIDCINQLQTATFSKYGGAKRREIHVYVPADVSCILQCSVLFKLPPDGTEATDKVSKPIGKISDWLIHEDSLLSNDTVRVLATFDTGDGVDKTMYGNVMVLDMPENGRKP